MMRSTFLIGVSAVVAAAAACGGPSLEVTGYQVPNVNLKKRALVLTDGVGSRAHVGAAIDTAVAQITAQGWFRAIDGTDDGRLVIDARGPLLTDGVIHPAAAYLRLDVVTARVEADTTSEVGIDEHGNVVDLVRERAAATVILVATAASGDGSAVVAGLETEGVAEAEGVGIDELGLLDAAMTEAVRRVLAEITPARTTQKLELDDRDPRQREIAKQAVDGDVAAALDAEAAVLAKTPSPAAYYNQGVMLDSLGLHETALASYEGARVMAPDAVLVERIEEAVRGCRARIAAKQALGL